MLRKILKWTGITIGSLLLLLFFFYLVVYFNTESRINKEYSVTLQNLASPKDPTAYARGKHIAQNRGCFGCHGDNLAGGRPFADENSPIGLLYSANITSGKGGVQYGEKDWIRVLRHGLNKENKSVWFMPSHEVYHLSNQEMSELIFFLKLQPPVDNTVPEKKIKPLGRLLTFLDKFPLLPAEMIDHNATYVDTVQAGITPQYGSYLATTCEGCHGKDMKGAPAHGPGEPDIPNITTTGNPGKWTDAQFMTTLRTGKTPEGKSLSDAMPWKVFTYTDDELKAIYVYLHGLK